MNLRSRFRTVSFAGLALLPLGLLLPLAAEEPRSDRVSMADGAAYDMKMSPSVISSRIYYEGSDTLGRVGNETILKRDILHQIRKFAYLEFLNQKENAPEEEKEKFDDSMREAMMREFLASDQIYTQILKDYICELLFYNDYVVSRSKSELEEQQKMLNRSFDTEYLPHLIEQMHCENQDELEKLFKETLDSSLDEERHLFFQQTISNGWVTYNLGTDQWEPTSHDLRRYYDKHRDEFKKPEQVRWKKMTVFFSNHPTREEAFEKIVYMGNAVQTAQKKGNQDEAFAKVARTDSEDIFASKGGECGWTQRGEVTSEVIDTALFSQDLPVGALSRILEDDQGLTIICVLERQKEDWTPFYEVQEELAKRIKEERRNSLKAKFEAKLAERFAVQIYKISSEERKMQFEAVSRNAVSATGRE